MTSIRIGSLRIRLPSETQNLFNPSYAFGVQRLGPNSGGVLALKDASSHEVLLPMDSEGNVRVRPGRDYELVRIMERHTNAKATAATSSATATAMTTSPAVQKNGPSGGANANERSAKSKRAGQPHGETGAKRARDADEEVAPGATPTSHADAPHPSRKEPKTRKLQSPRVAPAVVEAAHSSPAAAEDDAPSLAQIAHDAIVSGRHKTSPKSNPKASPVVSPATKEHEAAPLSLLFGDGGAVADAHEAKPENDDQPAPKKRGRKPKTQASPVTAPTPEVAAPPRDRSASPPEAAPVTLPPSTRGSVVRRPRPPFQGSSSDSD